MDALLASALVLAVTFLLASGRVRADLVAMLALVALVLLRIADDEQALAGFSSPATVTVAALFVISGGLQASGVVSYLCDRLLLNGPRVRAGFAGMCGLAIAPISAFVNNTGVVAVSLPIVLRACRGRGLGPSQLMMPLGFFAMLGGLCTLVGASTHVVVSAFAQGHGVRPFGMFELTGLGLVLLAAGALYWLALGRRLLPSREPSGDLTSAFELQRYLSELVVVEGSPLIGQSLYETRLGERYNLEVFGHTRDHVMRPVPDGYETLQEGDTLAVRAPADVLMRLGATAGLAVRSGRHPDVARMRATETVLIEAVITANSDLEGRTLKDVNFRRRYGATALAIRRGEDVREKIGRMQLRVGDELLIVAPKRSLAQLKQQDSFVVLQELDVPVLEPWRAAKACLIATAVVTAVATGSYPLAPAALAGAVLMVVSGCLPPRRLYQEVDWTVVLAIAGLIPLALALDTTGAAASTVRWALSHAGGFGPHAALGTFFVLALLVAGFVPNAATAVLLAPVAIAIAETLAVDPRPFLVGLSFAASAAFWTPFGHQANLLVRSPGGYRFADYVRVGGPLALLHAALATLLIPALFPFR